MITAGQILYLGIILISSSQGGLLAAGIACVALALLDITVSVTKSRGKAS